MFVADMASRSIYHSKLLEEHIDERTSRDHLSFRDDIVCFRVVDGLDLVRMTRISYGYAVIRREEMGCGAGVRGFVFCGDEIGQGRGDGEMDLLPRFY